MTFHPPFKDYAEDLSEQAVPKDHFTERRPFCGLCLLIGAAVAWAIIFGLRWAASLLLVAVVVTISYVGLGVLASLLLASGAYAHEAPKTVKQPLGWLYPYVCCSTTDCRPAKDGEVRETSSGYLMSSTGEVVPYTDRRVKDSPDGLFHTCQQGGNFDTGRVLCLFRPPRGF